MSKKKNKSLAKYFAATGVTLVLIVGSVTWGLIASNNNHKPAIAPQVSIEKPMLVQVNEVRAKAGKKALVEDPRLNVAAKEKLELLISTNTFDHQAPNGDNIFLPVRKQFPAGYKLAGENLAKCTTSTTQLVSGWAASPGHYKTMVGDYDAWGSYQVVNPVDNCTWSVNEFVKY